MNNNNNSKKKIINFPKTWNEVRLNLMPLNISNTWGQGVVDEAFHIPCVLHNDSKRFSVRCCVGWFAWGCPNTEELSKAHEVAGMWLAPWAQDLSAQPSRGRLGSGKLVFRHCVSTCCQNWPCKYSKNFERAQGLTLEGGFWLHFLLSRQQAAYL